MIKLALLIPTLDQSGAEKQFTLLATRLPRDEFEPHVIVLTRTGPYEEELRAAGIPVTLINKRMRFDPVALLRLRRLLREIQPDLLHSWLFAGNSYARIVAGRRPRPAVIVSERCVDTWKAGWQLALDRRQIPRTKRLIANAPAVAEFYQNLGYPADRVTVIPNGVDIPAPLAESDRDALLAEFDIPAGARVVGYVGRLAPQKRICDLVWGMQLLRQLTGNVYFLVVGDGPEQQRAIDMAAHMGCDHLCRFVGHRQDAGRLIQTLDVMWLASDFEGMSNSVMEAMAAGVPVVASDIPPNQELVIDGKTGFLVRVGDSVGFAQFADRILNDSDMARRLGTAGRQRMQDEFSIDRMVQSHIDLYRTAAGEVTG